MKLNSGGLKLGAIYIAYVLLMLDLAYVTVDPKARFFDGSLAWLPAGFSFAVLHLFPLLYRHPWTNTPFFLFPVSLLIVYLIGWGVSAAKQKIAEHRQKELAARLADAKSAGRETFLI